MRPTEAFPIALALCACLSACTPTAPTSSAPVAEPEDPSTSASRLATPAIKALPEAHAIASDDVTPAAARQVVVDYYAAIEAGKYAEAYVLWSDQGAASGQTLDQFSGGYANTQSIRAIVGEPADEEGAAGSRYIEVPVQLAARQRDGSERRYDGRFTLRAVMADGSSQEQRRWHLSSAEMQRLQE
jgi:hypothetical protein